MDAKERDGMYCDMCNEYYYVTDMRKVGEKGGRRYNICNTCVDFIDNDLEDTSE